MEITQYGGIALQHVLQPPGHGAGRGRGTYAPTPVVRAALPETGL